MFPRFYDENKIEEIYLPRFDEIKEEAFSLEIKPSSSDARRHRTAVLLIDFQIDFCNRKGSLYVPGAERDIANTIRFLLSNLEKITTIYPTLDSHLAFQIFYGTWWLNAENKHPAPFTIITPEDIETGKFRPMHNPEWSVRYVNTLKENGSKPLCIWPEHTMIGTPGHALVPSLYEVCYFHSIVRQSQTLFQVKGDIPESEMYGAFSPEVPVPDNGSGGINTDLIGILNTHDKILVMGEAKSHCVLESVRQLVEFFHGKPETLVKIHVFTDCMSAVRHPDIDFEAIAQREFEAFEKKGVKIIKSTDAIL